LPSVKELFRLAWGLYKKHFVKWLVLGAVFLGGGVVVMGLGAGALFPLKSAQGGVAAAAGAGVVLLLFAALFMIAGWGSVAFIGSLMNPEADVKTLLLATRNRALAAAWTVLVAGVIVSGGYLLLIVPGVLFTVWFFFALFVLADEDLRGLSAMLKSREYVRGRFWPVAGRLAVPWLVSMALNALPFVGQLLSAAFMPLSFTYSFLLFVRLKEVRGPVAFAPKASVKAGVVATGLLGYVAFPFIVLGIAVSILGATVLAALPALKQQLLSGRLPIGMILRSNAPAAPSSTGIQVTMAAPDDGEAVETLRSHPEEMQRQFAAQQLAASGSPEAEQALIAALKGDSSWSVRMTAADALGRSGSPEALEALVGALADDQRFVRDSAVKSLSPAKSPRATAALIARLEKDPDLSARQEAALALGELKDPAAAPVLRKALADTGKMNLSLPGGGSLEFRPVAVAAESALRRLGATDVPPSAHVGAQLRMLKSASTDDRYGALNEFYNTADPAALEPLLELVKTEKDANCRNRMLQVLGRIGDRRALEVVSGYAKDADLMTKMSAQEAVRLIEASAPVGVIAAAAPAAAAQTPAPPAKKTQAPPAAEAESARKTPPPAKPAETAAPAEAPKAPERTLPTRTAEPAPAADAGPTHASPWAALAADSDWLVRADAARALGDRKGAESRNLLKKLSDDPHPEVRRIAAESLERLAR
jgi:HEAT repeat protein